MIARMEGVYQLFVTVSPDDLRRVADSVQSALDHKEERGHVRADERIVSEDFEIIFVGKKNSTNY